ncbi:MAG: slipin family protein [Parcubacteria group bacterium]|nr:slipin family protein [Parcubacteria group bacterium]
MSGVSGGTILWWIIGIIVAIFLLGGLRVVNQYERGVMLTLGKYTGTKSPGLRWIFLGIQRMIKVDMRVKVVDVPNQDCMTKDNVSVNVNAVLYYLLNSAEKAVLEVEHFEYAVSQLAQTTMRDVVGEVTLDELLSSRDRVSNRIQEIVDKASDPWGIKVNSVDLKHIELPTDMKRTMSKEAEAERERRAVIIKAEGEKVASENLAEAARMLASSTGALHLRTLHSINDISSDQSNTVVFAVPLEILRAFEKMSGDREK